MKALMRVTAAAALFALCLLGQNVFPARAQPGPLSMVTFRCHVEVGPKLTSCKAEDRTDLDPRKIENLRQAVEDTPTCKLGGVTPGTEVRWPVRFLDSPALLEPRRPLQPGQVRDVIENPGVLEKPSAEVMAKLYPKRAQATGKGGRAVVDCQVNVDGSAGNCVIVEEAPPDAGFGAAAVEAASHFRFRPKVVDCIPTGGAHIRVPITFGLSR